MNNDMREIDCEELAVRAEEFPLEISVIRKMLAEVDEVCLEQAA